MSAGLQTRTDAAPSGRRARLPAGLLATLAAGLAAAVYLGALRNPFVYDDVQEILENPSIGDLTNPAAVLGYYPTRPLTNLTYAVDFAIGGLDPFAYHLTNLVLHVGNVLLLFFLVRRLAADLESPQARPGMDATLTAFTAASLFAVHPVMSGAVAYVSARAEVLAATLCLASLFFARRVLLGAGIGAAAALLACVLLAMGAKETAVMLPFAVLAYDALLVGRFDGAWRRRLSRVYLPLLGAGALIAGARVWWHVANEQSAAAGIQWTNALLNLHIVERYVSLLFFPFSQSVAPDLVPIQSLADVRVFTAAGLLGLIATAAVWARARAPLVTLGTAWFLLMLVPAAVLTLMADRGQHLAEYRVYVASCGFFMAVAAAIRHLVGMRPAPARLVTASIGLAAVLVLFMSLTITRNRLWGDPVLLWQDAVDKAPLNGEAHFGLADAHRTAGDHRSAVAAYEQALALLPDKPDVYLGLAGSLAELARLDRSRQILQAAVRRLPSEISVRLALARLEEGPFNNPADAVRLCREVVALAAGHRQAEDCVRRNAERLAAQAR